MENNEIDEKIAALKREIAKKKAKEAQMPKGIKKHIKAVGKITFLSEICGIIGLAFSIATFFYAQEISNQQNEMEKIARENEINRLTDSGSIYKLLIIKTNDEYKQSRYRYLLDQIISTEYNFGIYIRRYPNRDSYNFCL